MANVYAQKQNEEAFAAEKKKKKRTIILSAAIPAAILAVVILVLSLVPVSPYARFSNEGFSDPRTIRIYKTTQGYPLDLNGDMDTPAIAEKYNTFLENFKASKFTIMRGWLEGKFNTSLKINIEREDEDDQDLITNPILYSDIAALPSSANSSDKFFVEFWYTEMQSVTVKDTTIEYNRLGFFVTDNGNKITTTQIYFYNTVEYQKEDYQTYEITTTLNLDKLYTYINGTLINPES